MLLFLFELAEPGIPGDSLPCFGKSLGQAGGEKDGSRYFGSVI